jgi:hypothetical protein
VTELFDQLGNLLSALLALALILWRWLAAIAPILLLLVVSVWAINWKKMAGVLRGGAWAPLVLLMFLVAMVLSQLAPAPLAIGGDVSVPNFWWQLGAVGLGACVILLGGWLQGVIAFAPAEIAVEPAAHGHGGDHGHGHDHHDAHGHGTAEPEPDGAHAADHHGH